MCNNYERGYDSEGVENMAKVIEDFKINLEQSVARSLNDIEKIENGKLPRRSYKHMIERVQKKINDEEQ